MSQFCDDSGYGKCVCSNKSIDLKARLEAADSAASALQNFAMTDLTMVGEEAAAVAAMFSATEGELSIPGDGDQSEMKKKLDAIADRLSGGKSTGTRTNKFSSSIGSYSAGGIDFENMVDDIFSFARGTGAVDINLTGDALYENIHKQCSQMLKDVCSSKNMGLAMSLYKQDINKDCDKVERGVKGKEDNVKKGVSEASMMLMEARLDSYSERNSLNDIECLNEAMKVMTSDVICGKNWGKCLDFTGQYINRATGDPIYTANFKGIEDLLRYPDDGQMTIADNQRNAPFINKLNEQRMFLDNRGVFSRCRDSADRVWRQVIERSLIEIKSAQREKVEQVKDECMSKLATCMDVQTGAYDGIRDIMEGSNQYSNSSGYDVTGGGYSNSSSGRSAESIALANEICVDIKSACNKVFGNVFEGYMEGAFQSSRVKAMCTVNLKGKWNAAQNSCEISFY
jgi:hypothetical protein